MKARIDAAKAGLAGDAPLWVCYPKGGSKAKVETDLNRDILWALLADYDLKPNRQISIDDTWSALRFKIAE